MSKSNEIDIENLVTGIVADGDLTIGELHEFITRFLREGIDPKTKIKWSNQPFYSFETVETLTPVVSASLEEDETTGENFIKLTKGF